MIIKKAELISRTLLIPRRFEHAKKVANLLINPTEIEYAAALCHDLLEDTIVPEKVLIEELGESVFNIVKELTNFFWTSSSDIRDFSHLSHSSIEAKKIKLADRIDNIRRRTNYNINKFNVKTFVNYIKETEGLLDVLKDSEPKLELILQELIDKLKLKCSKYVK